MAKNTDTVNETAVEESQEVVVIDAESVDVGAELARIKSGESAVLHSFVGADMATEVKTLKALTNSVAARDNLNKPIQMVDYLIHEVHLPDENTGQVRSLARSVIIDADGVAYHAVSSGVYMFLKNLIGSVRHPSEWEEPLAVEFVEQRSTKNAAWRFVTLNVL